MQNIEPATFAIQVTFTKQFAGHTSQATNTEQGKDLDAVVKGTQTAVEAWHAKNKG